ncbi:MAG: helix-turn-helix transcriptional regulator [Gemmatimonadetes bacterium]|nr:helix-turn-helix transcriptional regulator [Gemmatimonadota bacterium]
MATTEIRGDVCSERCGSRQVLDLIADKWAVIVIYVLARGTRRFGELQRTVGGVSQKMLTQTLRGLERDGLVERKVFPVIPPRVEYSLSPLGETLVAPLSSLCRWAEEHFWEVERAREHPAAEAVGA